MTPEELRLLIFELLEARFRQERDRAAGGQHVQRYVGVQDDKVVVMQRGGQHLAVLVVPATVEVAG